MALGSGPNLCLPCLSSVFLSPQPLEVGSALLEASPSLVLALGLAIPAPRDAASSRSVTGSAELYVRL